MAEGVRHPLDLEGRAVGQDDRRRLGLTPSCVVISATDTRSRDHGEFTRDHLYFRLHERVFPPARKGISTCTKGYFRLHERDNDDCGGMREDVGNAVGHSPFGVSLPGGPPLATLQGSF